jgi:hypothetical protein
MRAVLVVGGEIVPFWEAKSGVLLGFGNSGFMWHPFFGHLLSHR